MQSKIKFKVSLAPAMFKTTSVGNLPVRLHSQLNTFFRKAFLLTAKQVFLGKLIFQPKCTKGLKIGFTLEPVFSMKLL